MTNLQAIDLLKGLEQSLDDYCELNDEGKTAFGMAITALELFGNAEQLPSAQPEQIARDIATIIENEHDMRVILQNAERTETNSCENKRTETHESCTDCPLYDHDRHNCPRFNRVIPRTIEAAKPRWIPCEECEKRCEKWENSKT